LPGVERRGSKFLQHRSFEEMALVVESAVGRGVDALLVMERVMDVAYF
jgi:hypothetical protein